ncbi:cytochrome b [Phreatobacter sp. HK31-P]
MTDERYDGITIALHWLMAILVIATYALGLLREELPRGEPRTLALMLHTSIGLTVIAGTVLRMIWRGFRKPIPEAPGPAGLALAAKLTHIALYVAVLAVPVLGVAAMWAKGRGIPVFGLTELASPWAADRALGKSLDKLHEAGAHLLVVLAGAHAAAAIAHHVLLRDNVLMRMLPRTR